MMQLQPSAQSSIQDDNSRYSRIVETLSSEDSPKRKSSEPVESGTLPVSTALVLLQIFNQRLLTFLTILMSFALACWTMIDPSWIKCVVLALFSVSAFVTHKFTVYAHKP